ncbi:MAG: MBL fold metallo-hydrolase [Nocardioidaceae bacterium]
MKIADGLHRLGRDIVNSYLVVDREGVTVVDAGLPRYWRYLENELASLGLSIDDVKAIVLTHGDSDHIGFAERLHRERGVSIHVHEADVERARLEVKKPNSGWGPVKVGPLAGFLWFSARHGALRIPPVTDLQTFRDGEVLDAPGSPRIIHTPGHTPGSVCVHVPSVGALFVGDAMTTRNVLTGAEGARPAPFTLDPAQAIESLAKVESVDAAWVLPGHGPVWDSGVAAAIRQIRASTPPA